MESLPWVMDFTVGQATPAVKQGFSLGCPLSALEDPSKTTDETQKHSFFRPRRSFSVNKST
ncbi:hypothetical protein GCM10008938_51650 [Deinococcus roseus]|uniref:Uncharacterized protein n=1 Tax=Deinococcus roseus TaxID=392414 RepID=A0ABQ2DMU5_9DEIO|nr:hypothetical protein GCM10008938_51650 [Deinococcus roseus]